MLSIVTPVLNGRKFIENTIESIQKLTIPHEHIIVDGGSEDGTIEFVKRYPNIVLIHQSQKNGMYGAIHQGFTASKGDYLTWVNADDFVLPEGYDILYKHASESHADLAYSHGIQHFKDKYYYERFYVRLFARYLLKKGIVPFVQPSAIFTANAYKKSGGLNFENFKLIGDRDLFQRMAFNKELTFLFVPVLSSVFLRYDNSLLYRNLEQRKVEYKFCIQTRISIVDTLLFHASQPIRKILWPFQKYREPKNKKG